MFPPVCRRYTACPLISEGGRIDARQATHAKTWFTVVKTSTSAVTTFWALTAGQPDSLRFPDSSNATLFWVQPTFTPRVNNSTHFFLDRSVVVYYEPTTTPTLLLAITAPPSSIQVTLAGRLSSATN